MTPTKKSRSQSPLVLRIGKTKTFWFSSIYYFFTLEWYQCKLTTFIYGYWSSDAESCNEVCSGWYVWYQASLVVRYEAWTLSGLRWISVRMALTKWGKNSWANTNAEIPKELSFSGKRILACQMERRLQNQVSNRIKIEKCRYQKNEISDNLDGPKSFRKTMKNIFQVTRRKPQFHSLSKLMMGKLFILVTQPSLIDLISFCWCRVSKLLSHQ